MRLLIVTEIPAPYRIPLFNELTVEPGVDLCVAFLAEHDPRRSYPVYRQEFAFRDVVLQGRSVLRGARWFVFSRGVFGLFRRVRPDVVVVGGWNQPAFWQALVAARVLRIHSLLWVESTAADRRVAGAFATGLRRLALALSTGFLVPGRASRTYLRGLGVNDRRIFDAPNAVDVGVFGERVEHERTNLSALRERLNLNGCVFLYVGRFEPEKGTDVLVTAMAEVPAWLVLIGSGSLEPELRAAANERTRFVGHLERDDLVPWYAAADVVVVPSRSDTWGMTLNEAAAAALPLVATDVVGGAHDLIEHGANGFRVPSENPAALADALHALASDDDFRRRAGIRSHELAARFTPKVWAAAVASAARAVRAGAE